MEEHDIHPTRPPDLDRIRRRIDDIDSGFVDLMATRLDLARQAAAVKREHGIDPRDLAREAAVVRRASSLARDKGLEPEVARDIFWRLISLSRRGR